MPAVLKRLFGQASGKGKERGNAVALCIGDFGQLTEPLSGGGSTYQAEFGAIRTGTGEATPVSASQAKQFSASGGNSFRGFRQLLQQLGGGGSKESRPQADGAAQEALAAFFKSLGFAGVSFVSPTDEGPGLTRERVLSKLTKLFKQSTAPLVVVVYCGPSDERGNWLLAGQSASSTSSGGVPAPGSAAAAGVIAPGAGALCGVVSFRELSMLWQRHRKHSQRLVLLLDCAHSGYWVAALRMLSKAEQLELSLGVQASDSSSPAVLDHQIIYQPGAFLQLYLTANKWRRGPNRASQQLHTPATTHTPAQPHHHHHHHHQQQQQHPGAPRSPGPSPGPGPSPHLRDPWLAGMHPTYYTTWLNDNVVDYGIALRFFNAPSSTSPVASTLPYSSPSAAAAYPSSNDTSVPIMTIPAFHSSGPTARDVAAAAAEHCSRSRSVLLAAADSAKCMAVPPLQQGGEMAGAGGGGQDGRGSLPWAGHPAEGGELGRGRGLGRGVQGSGPVCIGAGLVSYDEQEQGQERGREREQGTGRASMESTEAPDMMLPIRCASVPNAARRRYSSVADYTAQHVQPGVCQAVHEHPDADYERYEQEQASGQGAWEHGQAASQPPALPQAAAGGGGSSSRAAGAVAVVAAALAGLGAGAGAAGVSSPHPRVEMASADWHVFERLQDTYNADMPGNLSSAYNAALATTASASALPLASPWLSPAVQLATATQISPFPSAPTSAAAPDGPPPTDRPQYMELGAQGPNPKAKAKPVHPWTVVLGLGGRGSGSSMAKGDTAFGMTDSHGSFEVQASARSDTCAVAWDRRSSQHVEQEEMLMLEGRGGVAASFTAGSRRSADRVRGSLDLGGGAAGAGMQAGRDGAKGMLVGEDSVEEVGVQAGGFQGPGKAVAVEAVVGQGGESGGFDTQLFGALQDFATKQRLWARRAPLEGDEDIDAAMQDTDLERCVSNVSLPSFMLPRGGLLDSQPLLEPPALAGDTPVPMGSAGAISAVSTEVGLVSGVAGGSSGTRAGGAVGVPKTHVTPRTSFVYRGASTGQRRGGSGDRVSKHQKKVESAMARGASRLFMTSTAGDMHADAMASRESMPSADTLADEEGEGCSRDLPKVGGGQQGGGEGLGGTWSERKSSCGGSDQLGDSLLETHMQHLLPAAAAAYGVPSGRTSLPGSRTDSPPHPVLQLSGSPQLSPARSMTGRQRMRRSGAGGQSFSRDSPSASSHMLRSLLKQHVSIADSCDLDTPSASPPVWQKRGPGRWEIAGSESSSFLFGDDNDRYQVLKELRERVRDLETDQEVEQQWEDDQDVQEHVTDSEESSKGGGGLVCRLQPGPFSGKQAPPPQLLSTEGENDMGLPTEGMIEEARLRGGWRGEGEAWQEGVVAVEAVELAIL